MILIISIEDPYCIGSFTYYVISRGEGFPNAYGWLRGGGGGGLAVDYVIKILIFTLIPILIFFYLIHFPNEFLEPVF